MESVKKLRVAAIQMESGLSRVNENLAAPGRKRTA